MNKSTNKQHSLRLAAEARYTTPSDKPLSSAATLLHELGVHQIELEMQNETLRQTQLTLEASLEAYVELYDFSPAGYLTLTCDGLIAQANLTCAGMLGIERRNLLNQPFSRFISAQDADRWHLYFIALQKGSSTPDYELELQRHDKSLFSAHLSCQYKLAAGGVHTVRLNLTDITEQTHTKIKLSESEEKLQAIFEGALDGILLVDAVTKKFTSCNPALCRMLGYSEDEINQLGIEDMHPPQALPQIFEEFEKHLRGEARLAADIPFKRRDNSVFYADVTSAPVILANRAYLVGIIRDITERSEAEEALRVTAQKYQMLFESSRDALLIVTPPDWKFTAANQAALELFGVAKLADFVALGPGDISPPLQPDGQQSSELAQQMIALTLNEGSSFFEWQHQRNNGTLFSADVLLTRMDLGGEIFIQSSVRNTTARHRAARILAEAAVLAESEEKFRKITESAHDAIIIMDEHKCISFWNAGAERMFGYSKDEVQGREMHPLLAPDASSNGFEQGFKSFLKNGSGNFISKPLALTARRKDGTAFPVEVTISPLKIYGVWNAIGIFRDFTEHKLAAEQIRKLAFYDPLTQLPNRRLLNDRLAQAMAAGKRSGYYAALMFLDLDKFKLLNDQQGHDVGDLLLIEVAHRITGCLREMDTVARFGGDEFVVLLNELLTSEPESISQAGIVAEKIRAALSQPYLIKTQLAATGSPPLEHRCSSSIGVALFNQHELSAKEILKRADLAMYQAKAQGRDRVCFYASNA